MAVRTFFTWFVLSLMIGAAIFAGGCARKQVQLPVTQLPQKPASSSVKPESLTADEEAACQQQGPDAKKVCKKVEKNELIARDQQEFVDRLYSERDGK